MADKRAGRIAGQNDLFRKSFHPLMGQLMFTRGLIDLGPDTMVEVLKRVIAFGQFTEDNDPYGEHDFGVIELGTHRFFWKIDYYSDDRMAFGSRDPSDANQTYRLLTVMLASEY